MADQITVQVASDHIESLTKVGKPIAAIEELIWNALDEDATQVTVELCQNKMLGLQTVIVTDNGLGLPRDCCEEAFGSLGGSAKRRRHRTPSGRELHGKNGRGRFKSFAIGRKVAWTSRYESNGQINEYTITGFRATIQNFEISEEKPAPRHRPGMTVFISDICDECGSLRDSVTAADELTKRLAIYLRQYPGILVRYDGRTIDPKLLESHSDSYDFSVAVDGTDYPVKLIVIEWKHAAERAIYLCNEKGFAVIDHPPKIKAKGFNFTAYVFSPLVSRLETDDGLTELHDPFKKLIEKTRESLRTHFRKRESQQADELIEQWRAEDIYPYARVSLGPIQEAEQEVFNICARKVHEYLPGFQSAEQKSKRLTFRLIKEALEANPTSLQKILREVLALPPEQQDELATLLDKTTLSALINAASVVLNRLRFLAGLDDLLFDEYKKTLKERKQLHRILVDELWIFGEQYGLGVDDESLRSLLLKHIELLERPELATEVDDVTDLDGQQRILDLMLYRRYPLPQPNSFEHLVVELKSPSVKLGDKELTQIKKYAFAVSQDERFNKDNVRWTFVLVGNDLTSFARMEANVPDREPGLIYPGNPKIYIKPWSSIIDEAKWRYEFFRDRLEYDISKAEGLQYLRQTHAKHLPSPAVDI